MRDGFLGVERPGQPLRDVLPERVEAIVRGLAFSKSMRWDDSGLRFARPVRWRLAKLDEETVVGRDDASDTASRTAPVEIPDAKDTRTRLREAEVEPDAAERRRQIVAGLDAIGGWGDPAGVLDEVVHLVERPSCSRAASTSGSCSCPSA